MTEPAAPPPDEKDWTWVLERACPECGFDAEAIDLDDLPSLISRAAAVWPGVLARNDVRQRPSQIVWSPLEYACHVRDVMDKMTERNELLLSHDAPTFQDWDQDATALEDRYWEQDPRQVASQLAEASARSVMAWSGISGMDWQRVGYRSNGSEFTLATLGKYYLHDLRHHEYDVQRP